MRQKSDAPVLDMTLDGGFVDRPSRQPSFMTIVARLAAFGVFLAIGAALFWTALIVLPLLILAAIAGIFLTKPRYRL